MTVTTVHPIPFYMSYEQVCPEEEASRPLPTLERFLQTMMIYPAAVRKDDFSHTERSRLETERETERAIGKNGGNFRTIVVIFRRSFIQ